jgi:hypothetical protein
MGRGEAARRRRLWISVLGGVGINALLLASLILSERQLPTMDDTSLVISLERPEARRRTSPRSPARSARDARSSPVERAAQARLPDVAAAPAQTPSAAPAIDPAWAVDGGAWTDPARAADAKAKWALKEGGPFHRGRYKRACLGLTSEHMTDEEKDRCYGEWREAELRWQRKMAGLPAKPPPSRHDAEAARQERCRAYRAQRTPGNAMGGSSLGFPGVSDGAPLRQGPC